IIFCSLAIIILIVSIWPISSFSSHIDFSLPDDLSGKLEFIQPSQMRVGDEAEISLKVVFNQDHADSAPLTLFSKLELDNLELTPREEGKVTVDPSKPVVYIWKVIPHNAGTYNGTLWLFAESNTGDRDLILARPIELVAKTLFGVSYQMARIIGFTGLSTAIFLIFFPIIFQKLRGLAYNLM
ncbi:MAG: hypothetical protein Q8R09_02675, partial [Anaerolineaceae bacterium]|nr:hypothetical protein [Anaerolineaceae bacterium]